MKVILAFTMGIFWKFSETQPRPVAKNATPRSSVRIEVTIPQV